AGPEASGTDLSRHLVGGVEPGRTVLERGRGHLRRTGEDLVGVAVGPDVDVGRQPGRRGLAALSALHLLAGEPVEEVLDLRGVAERHRELAGDQGSFLVDGREGEPVVVDTRFRLAREEGVDEAGLAMQPATGRVLEHRTGRVAEGDSRRLVGATEDGAVTEPD